MVSIVCTLLLVIPYPNQPDWESTDDDYSTGGALVDIDLDGDVDFVTGNGNDMDRDPNRVYYNIGDSLEAVASWISADSGYNAHISVGDINDDGFPDLAVANYGDPYAVQYDKLYYNQTGTFDPLPGWRPHDLDNSFGCALGDVDGDGDLDLAVACGENYGGSAQTAKLYQNNGGVFDTLPIWESSISSYFCGVTWVDIDADGDLDLALAGCHRQNIIYRNNSGLLEASPYWQSPTSYGTIQIACGDVDGDGDQDMVCANNGQLGGPSNCELYLNTGATLDTLPAWTSQALNYYSCVTLGDVDRDHDLDIAAGGWWESVKVFENDSGSFPLTPSWQWIPSNPYDLVCENISFGDVDNTAPSSIINEKHIVQPDERVFYLENRWLISIDRVRRTSGDVAHDEYCFSYTDGWVSVKDIIATEETLWVDYTYAYDLDLAVTNWRQYRGNFLFYNRYDVGIVEHSTQNQHVVISFPNPNRGEFVVTGNKHGLSIRIFDALGRLVHESNNMSVTLKQTGIYFMQVYDHDTVHTTEKFIVIR
ncbi:hypothetical protein AMJ87_06755 [candidate division WOR_3 bacterium SM23_60]|uniref:Secretion system C-terminal sorting domain-containing protein n=1 Tax=candidate division WOR_3 bacterium SM23_60 TaxID=1703780 RepID=A0A0S8GJB5_UNCW3|nr:MAG: hypothetical protein AMJ87_06755 [candidate division WOR_3 bacterium SM23_60]